RVVEVLRYTIPPALSLDGLLTVRVVCGSVDGSDFYDWVLSNPLPLRPPCVQRRLTCRHCHGL
ncbi:hypothetical protein C2E23DRAFT_786043, partial [Lenzites betulinus]